MVRRIKPVVRILEINTRVSRIRREALVGSKPLFQLGDQWFPPVDIFEKEDDIVVEAEMPGIQAEELTVSVLSSRLEIRGVKKDIRSPGWASFLRLEREYGPFRRSIPLPAAVNPDKVKGCLKNGILTIVLKKSARRKKELERRP
jgi:HSP20 family protein